MPDINGVDVPWDVYNYVQNTGDTSKVAQYANPAPAPAPSGGTAGGYRPTSGSMEELLAQQAAAAAADRAAQMAYDGAMLKFRSDEMAYGEAQRVWQRTFDEEGRRIQGEQWGKNFGLQEAGLTGMYNGAPTFARTAQEAGITGYYNNAPTLARQAQEQGVAQNLLSMSAGLRGPSNYLTYLRTLGNTPRGMADLVGGLAGQYGFGQMQTSAPGSTYERQGLDTLARDFANPATGAGAYTLSGASVPAGNQWNAQNFNRLAQNPTQLGLLQNLYEESGRDWATELAQFQSSLPQVGGPRRTALNLG